MDGLGGYLAGKAHEQPEVAKAVKVLAPKGGETSPKLDGGRKVSNVALEKVFVDKRGRSQTVQKGRLPEVKLQKPIAAVVKSAQPKSYAKYTDSIILLNAREPLGKPDGEDENMKVLKLLNDLKKLQKKWKAKM